MQIITYLLNSKVFLPSGVSDSSLFCPRSSRTRALLFYPLPSFCPVASFAACPSCFSGLVSGSLVCGSYLVASWSYFLLSFFVDIHTNKAVLLVCCFISALCNCSLIVSLLIQFFIVFPSMSLGKSYLFKSKSYYFHSTMDE